MIHKKTILLTGATSGIGYEMATLLAADNHLMIVGRNRGKLDEMKKLSANIDVFEADLSVPQAGLKLSREIATHTDRLDLVIHNAAIQNEARLTDADFDPTLIAGEINTNLTSIIELTHGLLPLLQKSDAGLVCNINSGLALTPKTNSAVYCASKGGLNIFSQSLGYQFEGSGLRVCQAFLPLVDTPMTEGRGSGKISAAKAAQDILSGVAAGKTVINVGKVKLLRLILAVLPFVARRILKAS